MDTLDTLPDEWDIAEKILVRVLHAIPLAGAVLDEHRTIIAVNSAWREFVSRNGFVSQDDGIGLKYREFCYAESLRSTGEVHFTEQMIAEFIANQEQRIDLEYSCESPTGPQSVHARITRLNLAPNDKRVLVVYDDSIKNKQLNLAVEGIEQQYEAVFENSPTGILLAGMDGNIFEINDAVRTITGYDNTAFIGVDAAVGLNIHPENLAEHQHLYRQLLAGSIDQYTVEHRYRHRRGHYFWSEITGSLLRAEDESPLYSVLQMRDITSRKTTEESIHQIAEGVSAETGSEFFKSLVHHLGKTLDVDCALVGELSGDGDQITPLAGWCRGQPMRKVAFSLAGSPFERLIASGGRRYLDNIRIRYPDIDLLKELKAKSFVGAPVKNAEGKVLGVIAIIHGRLLENVQITQSLLEIFASRAAAEMIRERYQHELETYAQVVAGAPDFLSLIDNNYTYRIVNDNYHSLFDERAGTIVGRKVVEIHGEELYSNKLKPALDRCFSGEQFVDRYWKRFPDGRRHFETAYTPFSRQGEFIGAVVSTRDITDRVLAEESFRSLLESVADATIFTDEKGLIVLANDQVETMFGYESEELLGKSIDILIPGRLRTAHTGHRAVYQTKPTTGQMGTSDYSSWRFLGLRKNGEEFPVEVRLSPIDAAHGTITSSVIRDISVQIQTQAALSLSDRKFAIAFQSSPDPMAITRLADGRYIDVNDAFSHMSGFERGEVVGRTAHDLHIWVTPRDRSRVVKALLRDNAIRNYEMDFRMRSGEIRHCQIGAEIIVLGDVRHVLMVTQDVTEQRIADRTLREGEQRLQLALDAMDGGMWNWDLDTDEIYYSPQWAAMMGFQPNETIEPTLNPWLDAIHRDDQERVRREVRWYLDNPREPIRFEHRLITRTGEIKWVSVRGKTIQKRQGDIGSRITGVTIDITQTRRMSEQLSALAKQLDRVESREKRRLAAYLHDNVAQSLAIVKIELKVIQDAIEDTGGLGRFTVVNDNLEQAIRNIRSTTFELGSPILYELGLEAAIEDYANRIEKQHRINHRLLIEGDFDILNEDERRQIFDAVKELINNVVKHADARNVTIRIARNGAYIDTNIADDGQGFQIPAAGFTASQSGGYGLFALSHGISHLGGRITFQSQPGRGTQVTFSLPIEAATDSNNRNYHDH